MPYDADLVLRGPVSGTYVDLDSGDLAATTVAQNGDGNYVVDLGPGGTGALGLDCVIILHDVLTSYTNYADFVIEDSDHLAGTTANRGWQSLLTFPRVYAYMREVIVTATTAFTAAADFGVDLVDGGLTYAGHIIEFSRKLLAIGGTGKVWIAMQSSADTYATSGDTLTSAGGGIGTQIGASRVIQSPLILVRRFSTSRRYIRLGADAPNGGDFGAVDVLVTGSQHAHVNNLYR